METLTIEELFVLVNKLEQDAKLEKKNKNMYSNLFLFLYVLCTIFFVYIDGITLKLFYKCLYMGIYVYVCMILSYLIHEKKMKKKKDE
jgi:hypothetical protein